MRKEKRLGVNAVDDEILSKGKSVVKDFDGSREVYVEPKQLKSKLISIRLPKEMISALRKIAEARGDIGYQQVIKTYIAEGLIRDNQTIQCNIPRREIFWGSGIFGTSSSYNASSDASLTGAELTFK